MKESPRCTQDLYNSMLLCEVTTILLIRNTIGTLLLQYMAHILSISLDYCVIETGWQNRKKFK